MRAPGLYIVELGNIEPLPVNAHDARRSERCIRVCRDNCKLGKARDLAARERNYRRTFGWALARFRPIALLEDIEHAERIALGALSGWRLRGSTGRRNEWLAGISADEAVRRTLAALDASAIVYRRWTDETRAAPDASTPRLP